MYFIDIFQSILGPATDDADFDGTIGDDPVTPGAEGELKDGIQIDTYRIANAATGKCSMFLLLVIALEAACLLCVVRIS